MLTIKTFIGIYGIQRITTILSSFQSGLDDDPAALQLVIDSGADFSLPGTTPSEKALHRLFTAISASYNLADSYMASQAKLPIDPACYTEVLDCYVAALVLHKISVCPGQRTNNVQDDYDRAIDWLTLIARKTITLVLNNCPGQVVPEGESKGRFGYVSGDRGCVRYTRDCAEDQCGNKVSGFRTWIKESSRSTGGCCEGKENKAEEIDVLNSPAGEQIPAFKVVSLINSKLYVTDPSDTISAHSVVGIAAAAIAIEQPGLIKTEGVVNNPAWSFASPTGMLFVSLTGDVTDIPPTTGWSTDFGSIASPTSVFIDIHETQNVA